MARGDAVIDIDIDPFAARAARWRGLLRIGVPVMGVVLTIVVILAIAVYADQANRHGALALTEDVLAALDARISEQAASYFGPAARALVIGKFLVEGEPPGERREVVEKYSIGALKEISQAAAFIFGDQDGNFMMVRRGDAGGIDTKLIRNAPNQRDVLWVRRNPAGDEIAREEDPSDTFDPRTRPWYQRASISDAMSWTDVYAFYTADQPGVTASLRYTGIDGRVFVFGVDITLAELSRFLGSLKIGKTGRAMIIDGDGRMIAHPQLWRILRRGGESGAAGLMTARIDEIGDDVAAGAYDRFRTEGPGHRSVTVGDRRYVATFTPLNAAGRDWSVLIVAPEDDFISFVGRNNRIGLVMSLVIVALAALGATLLVRQGLRGDRVTRLMLERSRVMGRQGAALDHLADQTDLLDPSSDRPPEVLTETAADLTGAQRASLWYFLRDGQTLRCADSFDPGASLHVAGMELQRGELRQFFDLVTAGTEIEIADAAGDRRTADLYRLMLAPLGCRSLSIVPMRRHGQVVGAIWLEDPIDTAGSRHVLRILATTAGLRGGDVSAPIPLVGEKHRAAAPEPEEVRSLSADFASHDLDPATLGKALYPELCVFVMRVTDLATATGGAEPTPELIDTITVMVQELAGEQEIPYLKIVGGDIIGAAGFADDPTAASRIANIAVAGRDRLATLFEANGMAPEFRLGIDCGFAVGRSIGGTPRLFNLWGEAVRTARTMATTAFPGSIQTSERAYLRLRQSFLFRPRGSFYLPAVGSVQTFILAGRL
jgi:class 3 adenylate cyclase